MDALLDAEQLAKDAILAIAQLDGCPSARDLPVWSRGVQLYIAENVNPVWDLTEDQRANPLNPKPLHREGVLPPFPVEALPTPQREWVSATATALQVPAELVAFMALAVVSTCVAKRLRVLVRSGWHDPLNTYWIVALGSGERKSPVVRRATHELTAYERASREAQAPVRLLVGDTTPEALARRMQQNGERISLISAEGGVFDTLAGRYSNRVPNLDLVLQAHSGDTVSVDRKVGDETIILNEPALTIGLAVQPAVLTELADKPVFRGKGFLARFFYAVPATLVGAREIEPPPVPDAVEKAYRDVVRALLNLPEAPDPTTLELSGGAHAQLRAFEAELEPRIGPSGDLAPIADWAGKLVGGIARIAGLLHAVAGIGSFGTIGRWDAVGAETMNAAIEIGRYLVEHARVALGRMGTDPAVAQADLVLAWIKREGIKARHEKRDMPARFEHRDVQQALKSKIEKTSELEAALALLVRHGYLEQELHASAGGKPRKPTYWLHPRLWELLGD